MQTLFALTLLAASTEALRFGAVARPALPTASRGRAICMEEAPEKLVWNTAKDANGEVYYWNAAGTTQYEMPADFDASLARDAGTYKPKSGDLYDDQIKEGEIKYKDGSTKPQLSNTMREKMINESRGLGADPNQKNPFGLVFIGVGVFVCLGALAVNM